MRLRVGDYRVVCVVQDDLIIVTVVRVAHRRDVYRGL
jgi:mRNA interferase RelE/StbE